MHDQLTTDIAASVIDRLKAARESDNGKEFGRILEDATSSPNRPFIREFTRQFDAWCATLEPR